MQQTPFLVFFNIILFILAYLLLGKAKYRSYSVPSVNRILAIICIALFCVFAFYDTDYFHYKEIINRGYFWEIGHLEPVYLNIRALVNGSYNWFRTIVWGGALLIYLCTIKRLKLKFDLTLFLFLSMVLTKFAYGRVSLGWAIAFFGVSFLTVPIHFKKVSYLIGVLLVLLSIQFHDSMLFGAIVIFLSLVLVPKTRNSLILLLALFPFLVLFFQLVGADMLLKYASEEDSLAQGALIYVNQNKGKVGGLGILLQNILERGQLYLSATLYAICVWNKENIKWPSSVSLIGTSLFLYVLIASVFAFKFSINTSVLYYRFLYFSILPMIFFLSYCYTNNIHKKMVRFIINVGLLSTIYLLLYRWYCSYIGMY